MVRTCIFPPCSTASLSSTGISITHGPHHVAHRLTSSGLPLKSASVTSSPSGPWKGKSGAVSPAWLVSMAGLNVDSPPDEFSLFWTAVACAFSCSLSPDCLSQALNMTGRSEEHTSELQSLMRISYAVFCLTKNIYILNNTAQFSPLLRL